MIKNVLFKRNEIARVLFVILVFIIGFPLKSSSINPIEIPDGWSDGFAYANGIRIHYYHAEPASGKPVMVMVHGVTDIGLCWATLALKLQDDYDIYMLDTRGHGLSDPFTTSDDAETLIKDLVGFVEVMNLEKPILVGHSMGAATVMRVGAEYPDLAQAVIMLDPFLVAFNSDRSSSERGSPPIPPKEKAKETTQSEKSRQKNLIVNMFGDPKTLVAQNNYDFNDLVAKARHENPKWDMVDCKYWALSKKQYHGPYTLEAWQAMGGTMRTGDALSKIAVPSLVLKADAPPERRKANEEAVEGLEKVKLVHFDGTGHNLHHDELERTVEEIIEFISNL